MQDGCSYDLTSHPRHNPLFQQVDDLLSHNRVNVHGPKPPRSKTVFIEPVRGKVAGCVFAMTASGTVKSSIFGVVESAFARSYRDFTAGLRALRRILGGDPLGIAFEPASHL
jgi:hypothetical protein